MNVAATRSPVPDARSTTRSSAAIPTAAALAALDRLLPALAALWVGVMAGFFWAFTAVVMPGLAAEETAPLAVLAAMQGINDVVRNAQFALFFFGAPILCLLLLGRAVRRRDSLWRLVEAMAAALYVVGVFVVTFAFNVPLNDDLGELEAADPANAPAMAVYIDDWTAWNDVRTAAALVAFVLLAASLAFGRARRSPEEPRGATA